MIVATALASVGLFVAALWFCGVIRVAAKAVETANGAVAVIRDPNISDEISEKEVQQASLRLLGMFVSILLRSVMVFLISYLPIAAADAADIAAANQVIDFLLRWDVIVVLSIALIAVYVVWKRVWRPT